ncbi:hypothetical protein GCM10017608_11870 [Agromyces luteolus]|uniref:DUF4190 domain-containing protein n=1 Tax=Agromyces luteolus TaxID=88373 RepID=A0A7C9LFA2_9MICO|nr:hypothetical protein [Agromyces luteolus]MUN08711.1 hypothetical protein [Agromyces luteolus]GLK27254.1 hypothetical protein GCM10017608_11870 [Agromyces luteolus]
MSGGGGGGFRPGSGIPGDGEPTRRPSLAAIIGIALAVFAFLLPSWWALPVAAIAIVLGVVGRRQFRADPVTGPGWLSLTAIILGAFVLLGQIAILATALLSTPA